MVGDASSPRRVPGRLDRLVRDRAGYRCEYCHLPQAAVSLRLPLDHIIARQHGGRSNEANLALSCPHCNTHKGTNLTSIDPDTGRITPLLHPRRDVWHEHFRFEGLEIIGLTPVGRCTVALLEMNHPANLTVREEQIESGYDLI